MQVGAFDSANLPVMTNSLARPLAGAFHHHDQANQGREMGKISPYHELGGNTKTRQTDQ